MVTDPKWHIVGREGEKEEDRGGIFNHVTLPRMGPMIVARW